MKKGIAVILLAVLLVSYTVYTNMFKHQSAGNIKQEEKAGVGFLAPDFTLTGMDGKTYRLSDIKKPVIINFWASWCGPCRMETPHLIALYKKYGGQFEILAVNATINDKENNARKFVDFFHLPFPALWDRQGDVTDKYNIQGFPTNYFVNKDRKIVYVGEGMLPPEELEKTIQKMLTP
jgi:cytochrome c biogenesis protein CcmG, thiol:disulfide interchange protein DsbE